MIQGEYDIDPVSSMATLVKLVIQDEDIVIQSHCVDSVGVPHKIHKIKSHSFESKCVKSISFAANSFIEVIEDKAFFNLTTLKEVLLPPSLLEVNSLLWKAEQQLMVKIPEKSHIKVLKSYSLHNTRCKSLSLSSELEYLGSYSLPKNLEIINFDQQTNSLNICPNAFFGSSVVSLALPSSVKVIHDGQLRMTPELNFISFFQNHPKYVVSIDHNVYMKNVKAIVFRPRSSSKLALRRGIERIMNSAYHLCRLNVIQLNSLKELKRIEAQAFEGCPAKLVTLPPLIEYIGKRAFAGCKLKKLVIPNSPHLIISAQAFNQCNNLFQIDFFPKELIIHAMAFYNVSPSIHVEFSKDMEVLELGDRVFGPARDGFRSTFVFPKCVKCLHEGQLGGIGNSSTIKMIEMPDNYFMNMFGVLFTRDPLGIVLYPEGVEIAFPTKLEIIHDMAFANLVEPTSITFPASLRIISRLAFEQSKLENITFPSNSQLRIIGKEAFKFSMIKNLLLPSKLEIIGKEAFFGCPLKSVGFMENSKIETIQNRAFYHKKTSYTNIFEEDWFEEDEEEEFTDGTLESIHIPKSVLSIGKDIIFIKKFMSITFDDDSQIPMIKTWLGNTPITIIGKELLIE